MKFVEQLLLPGNTRIISLLGLYQALTGLWLIMPWTSFPKGYATWFGEASIGIIMFIIGCVTFYGSAKSKFSILRIGTTSGFLFWFVSLVLLLVVNPAGVGWIVCLIFSIYCLVVDLNLRVNYLKHK